MARSNLESADGVLERFRAHVTDMKLSCGLACQQTGGTHAVEACLGRFTSLPSDSHCFGAESIGAEAIGAEATGAEATGAEASGNLHACVLEEDFRQC